MSWRLLIGGTDFMDAYSTAPIRAYSVHPRNLRLLFFLIVPSDFSPFTPPPPSRPFPPPPSPSPDARQHPPLLRPRSPAPNPPLPRPRLPPDGCGGECHSCLNRVTLVSRNASSPSIFLRYPPVCA